MARLVAWSMIESNGQAWSFLQDRDAVVHFYEPSEARAYLVDVEVVIDGVTYMGEAQNLIDAVGQCSNAYARQRAHVVKDVGDDFN